MNDFLCIVGATISILMLLSLWGMSEMPHRSNRPPEHPPGYRNIKKRRK